MFDDCLIREGWYLFLLKEYKEYNLSLIHIYTISIAWFGLKGKTSDGALLEISFRLKEKGKSPLEIKELSLVNSEAEEIPVESADGQIVILAAGSLLSALPDYVVSHYLYFLGAAVIILIVVIFIIFHRRRKKRAVL